MKALTNFNRINLSMETVNPNRFEFEAQELPQKLRQISQSSRTGYWLFEFPGLAMENKANCWYLELAQGRVIFSGNQQSSWQILVETLQRYIPRTRTLDMKQAALSLSAQAVSTDCTIQTTLAPDLPNEFDALNLINAAEIEEALWLKVLSDLDTYLFNYSGQAQFFPFLQQEIQLPISGFEIEDLLIRAKERKAWWQKLPISIEAMESVPVLNTEVVESSNLAVEQRQRLKSLVSNGKTLNEIAVDLAQDSLEIAKVFARLVSENFVTLKSFADTPVTDIVIVDDSPILLRQFENLVTNWGYSVQLFNDPAIALKTLAFSKPSVIFLDINMPEITGFDLVKQIRRQPALSDVPLIMLTAEKTLSNNWKARWSGCRFLSKPLTPGEIPEFRMELRMLLTELVPLPQADSLSTHLVHPPETSYSHS